jgi:hypothetical protein
MLLFILSDNTLTQNLSILGRIAAIILTLYLFLFVVLAFIASLLLLYGNTWLQDKVELLRNLRLYIQNVDTAMHSASSETLPATLEPDNRFGQAIQAIHMVQSVQIVQKTRDAQRQVSTIEQKVEPVADRIAGGVIEFRARTVMAQSILKAFFLPGLIKQKPRAPLLLPAPLDTDRSGTIDIPAGGSNLPGGHAHLVGAGEPGPLANEGAEQTNDAPGH